MSDSARATSYERVMSRWGPLIGDGFSAAYFPIRRYFLRTGAVFAFCYVLGSSSIFILRGFNLQLPISVMIMAAGLGALGLGMRREAQFGRELAEALRRRGYPCDRAAPMRNTYLFEKWRRRNKIPTSAILRTGDELHPIHPIAERTRTRQKIRGPGENPGP